MGKDSGGVKILGPDGEPLADGITLFDDTPEFVLEDSVADFKGRPPENYYGPDGINYDALFGWYHIDNPPGWKEKVANLKNPEALKKGGDLVINWVTSPDIMASRDAAKAQELFGTTEPFFQLAIMGVLETSDGYVCLGVRGGAVTPERVDRFASGLYGLPPGGSVTFNSKPKKDPLSDTLAEEFKEELGGRKLGFKSSGLLGFFNAYKPGPTGIKFVSYMRTRATLKQVQQVNREANDIYWAAINGGASGSDAKAEVSKKGLPPDAWEHSPIIGLPKNADDIRQLVKSQPQSFPGIGAGGLELYAQYLES